MPQTLLHIIQQYAEKTDNKCGLTTVELSHRSGLSLSEVKAELTRLFHKGEIQQPREGAHGKLVMLKAEEA